MTKEQMLELSKDDIIEVITESPTIENLLIGFDWVLDTYFEGSMQYAIDNDMENFPLSMFKAYFSHIESNTMDSALVYLKLTA